MTDIYILMMIFVIGGIAGWIYEILFYYLNSGCKRIYMRGSNFLPFINIYSFGSLFLIRIVYDFKDKVWLVFLLSVLITGIIEYITGYVLDKKFNIRLWDYNKEILNYGNINGYICLRSVLVFGLAGLFLIYGLVPICEELKSSTFNMISQCLFLIFIIDMAYNSIVCRKFHLPCAKDIYKKKGLKYMEF